ncbi:sigma-70 family RNA polymerase sigma factor [Streptomyces sp. S3(2020)]|uniref:sigma-70 family RNA polymerase sigma factor n=1 Tax=Streptomyces sp. S3(2020) TaxID=2732044 RepID=UPI001489240F|nr:sigma-70 family RNA polymerase sigma factor [Streptomyces sp. S3(2020)]
MYTHLVGAERGREAVGTAVRPATGELDGAMSVFIEARPGLLRIARQILGDPSDAEDVIQETWLRWLGTDRAVVGSPWALLRTTTVRLAINVVQSAWRRRESCGSPWLPDLADGHASPEAVAEQHDAVERAVLLLMETLTPTQRAAYILREGFGHPYAQISGLLGLSVANARQQVSRAQHRLAADRRRQPVDPVAHRRLVQAFLAAARSGELGLLEGILATDAGRLPTRR